MRDRNFATWWMDLGAAGWFDDPRLWAEMTRLNALDAPLLAQPRPFRPEVAAVIDPQSMMRVAAGGSVVTLPGVYQVRRPLGRMGTPYGQYLQDDVIAGKVPAKMYVFLTAWCLARTSASGFLQRHVAAHACGATHPVTRNQTERRSRDARAHWISTRKGDTRESAGQTDGSWSETRPSRVVRRRRAHQSAVCRRGCHSGRDISHLSGRLGGDRPAAHGRWSVAVCGCAGTHIGTAAARCAGNVHCTHNKTAMCMPTVRMWCSTLLRTGPWKWIPVRRFVRDLLDDQIIGTGPKITLPFQKGETRVLAVER